MAGARGAACQARLDALGADCARRELAPGHPDWPDEHARPEEFHSMGPWTPCPWPEDHPLVGTPGARGFDWVRGCTEEDCGGNPVLQSSPIPGVTKGI